MNIKTKDLRKLNKEKVIQALYEHGECNKNQLSQYTSLSIATCFNVLQELLQSHEVIMGEGFKSTGGRKAKSYKLNEDFDNILTISFYREFDVIYYEMKVFDHIDQQIYQSISQKSIIEFDKLCQDIQHVLDLFPHTQSIALSIPGIITREGTLDQMTLINGLEKLSQINIKGELEKRFHKHIIIENDVNVAGIGYYASHQDIKNIGYLYQPLDDLAGLAFIVDGQLMKGTHGLVGEVPFLPLLTKQRQYEYMKTQKGMVELLSQLILLIMVFNDPQQVVLSCSMKIEKEQLYQNIQKYISHHFIPEIIFLDNIKEYIFKGLILMSRESLTTNLVMKTQKVYK